MAATATQSDALRFEAAGVEIKHLEAGMLTPGVPGIHILFSAARNGPGMGHMKSTGDGSLVSWRAPGSNRFGLEVDMSGGGTALLLDGQDDGKFLRVQATTAFLLPSTGRVFLKDVNANTIADSNKTASPTLERIFGYAFSMKNASTRTLTQIRAWLDPGSVSGLSIRDGVAGGPWVSPTAEVDAVLFPDLEPDASHLLSVQRTIPAGAPADPDVLVHMHASWRAF